MNLLENNLSKDISANNFSQNKFDNLNYKKLINFLNKVRINKKDQIDNNNYKVTHTSINNPKGSFNIADENLNIFLDLYKNVVSNNIDMYFTESHNEQGPLILDIDIKYHLSSSKTKERIYNKNNVIELITVYNELI